MDDDLYHSARYRELNPTWHAEDSPWKAEQVARLLQERDLTPTSICDVGCGAGLVLASLAGLLPEPAELTGIDVSEEAPSYKLVPEGYSRQGTAPVEFLDTAIMINGHVIVFESGVSTPYMEEIATQYAEILVEHQIHETANAIVRLFITLFIPIVTLGLFGWAGSSLWRAIQKLD